MSYNYTQTLTPTTPQSNNSFHDPNCHFSQLSAFDSHNSMAWALYLSNTTETSVTDAQLAELDDYELIRRSGVHATKKHLHNRIGPIIHALICAAGAINSRSQMLRSINLLHSLLTSSQYGTPQLLENALKYLIDVYSSSSKISSIDVGENENEKECQNDVPFLKPLVQIAINRVSDIQLSTTAAHSLAILLGCKLLDDIQLTNPSFYAQIQIQTKKLVALLITEIVLTSSPKALASLSMLLKRDGTKLIFCEKDGVSTLAATLQTEPNEKYTAIGQIVISYSNEEYKNNSRKKETMSTSSTFSDEFQMDNEYDATNLFTIDDDNTDTEKEQQNMKHNHNNNEILINNNNNNNLDGMNYNFGNNAIYASYHAVFSVWMLTFMNKDTHVEQTVLKHIIQSRLSLILVKLLNHSSGQRLKIARVTLASLKNLINGQSLLHKQIKKDLVIAGILTSLKKLMTETSVKGSLMGNDEDALNDANILLSELEKESFEISTIDQYKIEVKSRILSLKNPIRSQTNNNDHIFWIQYSDVIINQFKSEVIHNGLAQVIIGRCQINNKIKKKRQKFSDGEEHEFDKDSFIYNKEENEKVIVACSDLTMLMKYSGARARAVITKVPNLKISLMQLMVEEKDAHVRNAALLCVQMMLVHRSLKQ